MNILSCRGSVDGFRLCNLCGCNLTESEMLAQKTIQCNAGSDEKLYNVCELDVRELAVDWRKQP